MPIITELVPGGQGIATLETGQKAFFWNALPGENVLEYQTTKQKSHFFEAIATKIVNPSSQRIEPKDSCFLATSPWQILDYSYELAQKLEILQTILKQHHLEINPEPVQTDYQDFFYRNKMEYSLYWDHIEQKIQLAFHQRGTHRKIPIDHSSLERPEIFQAAQKIIEKLNQKQASARDFQSLLLRVNQSGQVSGGLLPKFQSHPIFPNLSDQILDTNYSYSPNGFFQINLPLYTMALTEIKKHINQEEVLDLYAGVGSIGLTVAKSYKLTLVEVNGAAFKELVKNAKTHPNAKPILAKSEEVTDFIKSDQVVILDPPRAGCDKKLIEKLLSARPTTIIYLSCNPATAARDLKLLEPSYLFTKLIPYNFFPRTPHLEILTILKLR